MKHSTAIKSAALLTLLAGAPCLALACDAAGSGTHAGRLLSLSKSAGTFTLLDAETMSPVTLAADAALLDQISSILYHAYQNDSGGILVTYEKDGDMLRALELK